MSKRVCQGDNPVVVDAEGCLWRYDERQGKYVPVNVKDTSSKVNVSHETFNMFEVLEGGTISIEEVNTLYQALSSKPTRLLITTETGLKKEYVCLYNTSDVSFSVGLMSCFDTEGVFKPHFTNLSFDISDPSNIKGHIEASYVEDRLAYLS